ncbi:MAG: hypothetical protein ACRDSH_22630, partial [Pseudonocardiaceae bacterium]
MEGSYNMLQVPANSLHGAHSYHPHIRWPVSGGDIVAVRFTCHTPSPNWILELTTEIGMDDVTPPTATVPVYPFGEPGHDIVVHEGDIEIVGVGVGVGTVSATTNGSLDIKWEAELPTSLELGDVTLRLQRPDLGFVELGAAVND